MFFRVIQQDYRDILSWPDLSGNPHVYARLNWPSSGFIYVASLLLVHLCCVCRAASRSSYYYLFVISQQKNVPFTSNTPRHFVQCECTLCTHISRHLVNTLDILNNLIIVFLKLMSLLFFLFGSVASLRCSLNIFCNIDVHDL